MDVEIGMLNGAVGVGKSTKSNEIVGKSRRRVLNAAYIEKILAELDQAPHGESGKILRREGLYSTQVVNWRKQKAKGAKATRGRKGATEVDLKKQNEHLQPQIARLERKLDQAEKIIEVQKKVSALLEFVLPSSEVQ